MERELRDLVARSHLSVAHAAALVQIEAAHGAVEQARGRLDELVGTGLDTMRPDMLFIWALTELARGCVVLRAARHAPRLYRALAPYAGRAAVAAGAVLCAGSADYYLAGLAALTGDTAAADRHYRAAAGCHRRLGARPMLAHTLYEHAQLLRQQEKHDRARRGAGHRRRLRHDQTARRPRPARPAGPARKRPHPAPRGRFLARRLRGRRHPGTGQPGPALPGPAHPPPRPGAGRPGTGPARRRRRPGQHRDTRRRPARRVRSTAADEILDQQARTAYRQRLTALDEDLAEADQWNDTERASRLRAEKDFLVRELAAATGLGGRPRRLGAESERARLNVTRAIRSAIARIRDRAPAAAAHLDQAVRTGTRCSYSPPNHPGWRLRQSRPWPSYPPAIARCALALITAIVSASCSFGLNWMNSVPVSAAGTCPGVM